MLKRLNTSNGNEITVSKVRDNRKNLRIDNLTNGSYICIDRTRMVVHSNVMEGRRLEVNVGYVDNTTINDVIIALDNNESSLTALRGLKSNHIIIA